MQVLPPSMPADFVSDIARRVCACLFGEGPLAVHDTIHLAASDETPIDCSGVRTGLRWRDLEPVGGRLGIGGSCEVRAAWLNGREVAVKCLLPGMGAAARADLEKEAELLSQLYHRHVLRCLGRGETDDGLPFMVLERLSGTLSEAIPRPLINALADIPTESDEVGCFGWAAAASRWPLRRALLCALQLARALRYLHSEPMPGCRVLHRDLKPDNIGFLADGVTLVLFDFGLATAWNLGGADEGPEAARPLTGETGSLRYMAPEISLSQPYNHKAEVYGFGVLLWQLASHERPYRGVREAEYQRRVARGGERPPLSAAPHAGVRALIGECWRAEPRERPGFDEIVPRVEALLDGLHGAGAVASDMMSSPSRSDSLEALRPSPSSASAGARGAPGTQPAASTMHARGGLPREVNLGPV